MCKIKQTHPDLMDEEQKKSIVDQPKQDQKDIMV
jgi:hypothetical protein